MPVRAVDPAAVPKMLSRARNVLSGSALRRDLLRGGLGSLTVKVAHAGLAFAVAVTLARMLGPADYGVYAFALSVMMILALPAQVGLPQLVVRETAKTQADGEWGLMRGLWRWSNRAVFLFSGLAMAGVVTVLWWVDISPRVETLAIGAALIPLIALGNLRAASLRGLRRVLLGQLPESVVRPLVLLAILLGAAGLGFDARISSPQAAMAAYVVAVVTAFMTGAAMLHWFRPSEVAAATPRTTPTEWRRAVLPLAMIAGLQLVNNQADIIVLGIFRSNAEVGIYRAVFQMALLVVFGLQAMNQMLQPYFAGLYRQGDMCRLQRLLTISARAVLLLALPPVLTYVFFGGDLLEWIFGEPYRAGATALAVLAIAQLVNAGMGSVGHLLNMTGHERDTIKAVFIAAIANLGLNTLLIPIFGLMGAAVATTISIVIWNFSMRRSVIRRTKLEPSAIGSSIHA